MLLCIQPKHTNARRLSNVRDPRNQTDAVNLRHLEKELDKLPIPTVPVVRTWGWKVKEAKDQILNNNVTWEKVSDHIEFIISANPVTGPGWDSHTFSGKDIKTNACPVCIYYFNNKNQQVIIYSGTAYKFMKSKRNSLEYFEIMVEYGARLIWRPDVCPDLTKVQISCPILFGS